MCLAYSPDDAEAARAASMLRLCCARLACDGIKPLLLILALLRVAAETAADAHQGDDPAEFSGLLVGQLKEELARALEKQCEAA